MNSLEEFCVERISTNIKSVFKTIDFLTCERVMLYHILSLDALNCNETEVFDACISWAQSKCEHEGLDAASTANLRDALGDAIFKIRFCSMTGEQFATIDENYSGIFLERDSIQVYRTILLRANDKTSSRFGEFNGKAREPIESTLECSFSKGLPITFHSPLDEDSTNLSCDKTINVNGFVICNRMDFDVKVQFGVLESIVYKKYIWGNETKIVFDNPIQLKANKWCYIRITSDIFKQSSRGWHGFNVVKSVEQNGVTFQIDEDYCDEINFITRLLYNTID